MPELVCAERPLECAGAGLTRALAAVNRAVPLQRRSRAPTVATAWAQQNNLLCSTHLEVSYSTGPQNNNSEPITSLSRDIIQNTLGWSFPLLAFVYIFIVTCNTYCVLTNPKTSLYNA